MLEQVVSALDLYGNKVLERGLIQVKIICFVSAFGSCHAGAIFKRIRRGREQIVNAQNKRFR
jgi:hypothetical protein